MDYRKLKGLDRLNLIKDSKHKWVIDTYPYDERVTRDGVDWLEVCAIDYHYDCESRLSVLTLDCYCKDCDDPFYNKKGDGYAMVTFKKSNERNDYWEHDYEVWKGDEKIDEAVGFEFITGTEKNPSPRIRLSLVADVEWKCHYEEWKGEKDEQRQ